VLAAGAVILTPASLPWAGAIAALVPVPPPESNRPIPALGERADAITGPCQAGLPRQARPPGSRPGGHGGRLEVSTGEQT
jgi:hypothetical protein